MLSSTARKQLGSKWGQWPGSLQPAESSRTPGTWPASWPLPGWAVLLASTAWHYRQYWASGSLLASTEHWPVLGGSTVPVGTVRAGQHWPASRNLRIT